MESRGESRVRKPRPAWGRLYAVIPLAAALLVAAHLLAPLPAGREVAEWAVSLLVIGVLALWVRANRLALMCCEEASKDGESLRVWVAHSPQPVPRREASLAGIERN